MPDPASTTEVALSVGLIGLSGVIGAALITQIVTVRNAAIVRSTEYHEGRAEKLRAILGLLRQFERDVRDAKTAQSKNERFRPISFHEEMNDQEIEEYNNQESYSLRSAAQEARTKVETTVLPILVQGEEYGRAPEGLSYNDEHFADFLGLCLASIQDSCTDVRYFDGGKQDFKRLIDYVRRLLTFEETRKQRVSGFVTGLFAGLYEEDRETKAEWKERQRATVSELESEIRDQETAMAEMRKDIAEKRKAKLERERLESTGTATPETTLEQHIGRSGVE